MSGVTFGMMVVEDGERALLRVCGEVDMSTAARFGERLFDLQYRRGDLELDLSRVTFIDCSGARVLTQAAHDARSHGRRFSVGAVSIPVRRLLALLELDRLLGIG